MKPSQLIRQVHEREYERIRHWTGQYLPEREAADLARHAIVEAWTQAVMGENTRRGAIAFMQAIISPRIRRMREIAGSYLPVDAPLTVDLPSWTELHELADAYSLVMVTALHYDADWTMRRQAQMAVNDHMINGAGYSTALPVQASLFQGKAMLAAAAAELDSGAPIRADEYGYRDACRRRELDRSRRWIIAVTAHQRGADGGSFEQVHDRGVPRQDEPDDQVAGSRPSRCPAPGEHEGTAD